MPRKPPARPPSIRDVAVLAGVSVGSASRVVNQAPNVTPATRERVQQAIATLGYRPNHAAQSLRLRSTRTVGCLLSDIGNPLYARLFRAFEERLRAAGYLTLLANSLNEVTRELEILDAFQARGMDGLILAPGNERDSTLLGRLKALDRPAVLVDRDMQWPVDRVLFDHVPGMRRVVTHLAGLGHRRMALVLSATPIRPMRLRVEGFRRAHAEAGLPLDEALIVQLPTSTSLAFEVVRALLARQPRPTALVVLGTTMLHDALHAIQAQGLSIPRDVSVVSIGSPDFAEHHVPPICALGVDLADAGAACSQLLLSRLQGGHDAPRTLTLPCTLMPRGSCGPVGSG